MVVLWRIGLALLVVVAFVLGTMYVMQKLIDAQEQALAPACCKALTATCMSCVENVTIEEYCAATPGTVGCEKYEEEVFCCMAETASCKACSQGISIEQYCAANPSMDGC